MSPSSRQKPSSARRGWATAVVVAVGGLAAGTTAALWAPSWVPRPAWGDARLRTQRPGATTSLPSSTSAAPRLVTPDAEFAAVRRIVAEAESTRTARAVGVAVYDLQSDGTFGVRPNRVFKPASVIKLAVMVATFQAREEGLIPEVRFERLRPYLRRMITVSDNPSTSALVRTLGRERVNAAMVALGLRETHLSFRPRSRGVLVGSTATPAEVALLLAKLARREVVSPRASNEMLLLLGASERRARIPAGLPKSPGLWVGNKTGTLAGLVHDSAVVLDPARGIGYTLAIFTEGARSEAAGQRICVAVSRAVYAAMSRGLAAVTENSRQRKAYGTADAGAPKAWGRAPGRWTPMGTTGLEPQNPPDPLPRRHNPHVVVLPLVGRTENKKSSEGAVLGRGRDAGPPLPPKVRTPERRVRWRAALFAPRAHPGRRKIILSTGALLAS